MADQMKSMSVWMRAFIPSVVLKADSTESSAAITGGPHSGKKVIPGPLGIGWFHTDDRTFASQKDASSRAHCEALVDFVANQASVAVHRCDQSMMFTSLTDASPATAVGDSSRLVVKDFAFSNELNGGKQYQFTLRGEASNPLVPGSPDIDWDIKLTIELDAGNTTGRVLIKGLVDPFPAYEMYLATNSDAAPRDVFKITPAPGKDPWDLIGNPNIPVEGAAPFSIEIGASLDGTWVSNDANHRFQFQITGNNVVFTERKSSGATHTYSTQVKRDGGVYQLDRPNNDSMLLTFLEFKPAVRTEILNRNPIASFHRFFRDGDVLRSKWCGLLVTLKPDGTFNQMFNPGEKPPKDFEFTKTA